MKVTAGWVREQELAPGYPLLTEDRMERLCGCLGKGLSRKEFLQLYIPARDKIAVAAQSNFLSKNERRRWIRAALNRAVRYSLGNSDSSEWETWAQAWLGRTTLPAWKNMHTASDPAIWAWIAVRQFESHNPLDALIAAARGMGSLAVEETEQQVEDLLKILARTTLR